MEKISKREACRRFGIHWDTLERILANPAPPGYQRKQAADKSVMAPWLGRLKELVEANGDLPRKQRYTVRRMWQVLGGEGFAGGYTTVKDAVREMLKEAPKEVFMPLIQPPGEAQVDFGHALARISGRLQKVVFFVMSMVHSDAMFVMAFPRECTEAFGEAHLKAFAFFGFVAGRISYDNTKVAVTQITGPHERKLTTAFARLVGHYLFRPHFCRIRRANEKGVVEGAVRYSRQNFMVPVPQVADWAELNAHLLACCRSDMTRRLRGKALSKGQLLEEDKVAGLAIPAERFDPRRLVSTTATSESLVRLDTNDYSVPVEYGHRPVVIKASVDTVSVYHAAELIGRHERCWEREKQVFDPRHYLSLLDRKPGSLDHARPFAGWGLPEDFAILRRRLEAQREDGTREYIRALMLLRDYPLGQLVVAVRHALRWTAPTADAIKQLLIPCERPELKTFHLAGREHLAGVTVAATDLVLTAACGRWPMSERKATVLLEHHLKQLKLPTILREYAAVAAVCGRENQPFETFLLQLCERELIDRQQRATERRVKAAAFPTLKTIEGFDFAQQTGINEALVRELLVGEFIDRNENILLIGNSGTGKTHLAIAVGLAACHEGRAVRFFGVTSLVTQLLEAREDRRLERMLKQLGRQDLLILDELGYVPFTKAGAELLFEVVSRAYERQSLVITTNLPFEQWAEVCGSERLTGAMLDRLTHRVHIVEANGQSYRLRDSQQRIRCKRADKTEGRGENPAPATS